MRRFAGITWSFLAAICIVLAASAISLAATTVEFRKIADTSTQIPGGTGSFAQFDKLGISKGCVVFWGRNTASTEQGIYTWRPDGSGIRVVADRNTDIPGSPLSGNPPKPYKFTSFSNTAIDGDSIAFCGGNASYGSWAYRADSGVLRKVFAGGDSAPYPGDTFWAYLLGTIAVEGNRTYFDAWTANGHMGLYVSDSGVITTVADEHTLLPDGQGGFVEMGSTNGGPRNVSARDGAIAFQKMDIPGIRQGIYWKHGSEWQLIHRRYGVIPGIGSVYGANKPLMGKGCVVFNTYGGYDAIYEFDGTSYRALVSPSSQDPIDGTQFSSGVYLYGFDGANVLFSVNGRVYALIDEQIVRVVRNGDSLDGKTVSSTYTNDYDLIDQGQALLPIAFTDGSTALYLATLTSDPATIQSVRLQQEDSIARIDGAIVSAVWDDAFYIQTDDGSAGIRVEKTAHGLSGINQRANVQGTVVINSQGERCIRATKAESAGGGSPRPIGITCKAIGGGALLDPTSGEGQQGMYGRVGLNNVGALVKTWGKIVDLVPSPPTPVGHPVPPLPAWIVLDDGSGNLVKCLSEKSDPYIGNDWLGKFAIVTGASSCEKDAQGLLQPVVRIKVGFQPQVF